MLIPFAIFFSAALVFLVQPLVGRLLLPSLGGAPAVWNTSLVFFQATLLLGYAYAHALQRLRSVRGQAAIHCALLLAGAAVLPLSITSVLGEPTPDAPAGWLLAVLSLSIGAPFAALSATAPLLQAWWAAAYDGRRDPYPLYAASNLGSLAALLAYPLVVEPLLDLDLQRLSWSGGYAVFTLTIVLIGLSLKGARRGEALDPGGTRSRTGWGRRAWWALLGAIPSSLLLGVTAHVSTDVASAPLLWVIPLALYLLSFVLAFQERPAVPFQATLIMQAIAVAACLAILPFSGDWRLQLPLHLLAFFLTALMCHQRVAAGRPEPGRLTEFYLFLSIGGVLGGAFNALAAPSLFDRVWEYPLALILAGVARPFGPLRLRWSEAVIFSWGAIAAALAYSAPVTGQPVLWVKLAIGSAASAAFFLRDRAPAFIVMLGLLALAATRSSEAHNFIREERGFFGVYRVAFNSVPQLGPVRFLMHGTTLHGAQRTDPGVRCRPMTYYSPGTPLGEAMALKQQSGPVRVGVVGLGAGTLAAWTRSGDALRFYEIDPLVEQMARTSFSYLTECARGDVDTVLGDARLTVAREPAGSLDLLFIDAFSSDAVPTHLMTLEAMQGWLRALKPDGVLVLHISNRNLELEAPVTAAAQGAGAQVAVKLWAEPKDAPPMSAMSTHAVVASREPRAIDAFRQRGWRAPRVDGVQPWTDDRTDVLGALIRDARSD
jgi:SAM-dependent methyltransferase